MENLQCYKQKHTSRGRDKTLLRNLPMLHNVFHHQNNVKMIQFKDDIISLFKSDDFSYGVTDEQITISTTFISDFRLQSLEMYCFKNRLYYDVTAKKNNVIITIQQDDI